MRVAAKVKVDAEAPVATVSVDSKNIELKLFDPATRNLVCDALTLCRVRPLNMLGRPKPPQPLREGTFSADRLREIIDLAEKHPTIPLGTSSVPGPVLLTYAQKRVAYEEEWAARNPEKYKTIRIFGAGQFAGRGTTPEEHWTALRAEFATHHGKNVSTKDLSRICWAAIKRAMPPEEFFDLQIALR